jgi:hypothetical protein
MSPDPSKSLYSGENPCRCGYDGNGVHQCHYGRQVPGEHCENPGVERFWAYPTCLAGMQMKLGAVDGCYCEEHWALLPR